jgi:hypothetical protein
MLNNLTLSYVSKLGFVAEIDYVKIQEKYICVSFAVSIVILPKHYESK